MCATLAGEAYIHGWDVARALGRPWRLLPQDKHTIFLGLLPVLPYVDPQRAAGLTATFDVRLRGKISTSGRRPWLGLRLPGLFRRP